MGNMPSGKKIFSTTWNFKNVEETSRNANWREIIKIVIGKPMTNF